MAGIGIGFLDALPIFGTGTALVPWTLLELFGGEWKRALFLAGLYLICYLTRQVLEAHVMGGRIGLSPLETLAAVYVGLELFGFFLSLIHIYCFRGGVELCPSSGLDIDLQ